MNATIARLTWRSLLGRRRAVLLMVLPAILILLAVLFRVFQGTDPEAMARRLAELGVPTRTRHIAPIALFQIFVTDPDGLAIELNFPGVAEPPHRAG